VLAPSETATIGSAGSTSASRQTWMSGGAVERAALAVRARLDAGEQEPIEETYEHHHPPTSPLDEDGQGDAHVSYIFAAHRAVVDVDLDLGLVRVVEIATSQDVGRVLNPVQVVGQIEGGIAQGVGLAVMEEIVLDGGVVRNASFTDYLIPTALDMPEIAIAALIEEPEPGAPFGAKGVGETPTISSSAAVAAAVRDATGLELPRIPIRPQDISLAPGSDQRHIRH
jgi:CO/xanthine dehydrogenase Mo-binding subunit